MIEVAADEIRILSDQLRANPPDDLVRVGAVNGVLIGRFKLSFFVVTLGTLSLYAGIGLAAILILAAIELGNLGQHYSRLTFIQAVLLTAVLMTAERYLLRQYETRLRRRGVGTERVLMVGTGPGSELLIRRMVMFPQYGFHVIGVAADELGAEESFAGVPVVGKVGELPALAERWFVIHLTGDGGYAEALASRQRLPDALRARYRAEPFLREGMVTALAAADLVVGRAGSSTLAEVTAFGLPMVVVPYRFAGGHQHANAEALVAAGAARIVEDEAFDGSALLDAATILDDPATHATMSAAARSLGRPAAADAVADLLLALAKRAPLPSQAAIAAISRGGPA